MSDEYKTNEENKNQNAGCRIKIYGSVLGTTSDIIDLWKAIEINYIFIMAYSKVSETALNLLSTERLYNTNDFSNINKEIDSLRKLLSRDGCMSLFMKYSAEKSNYPQIVSIKFNSPGFWEVIGNWNIFEQIRKYIQERHSRIKDREFWDLEAQERKLTIERQQLDNDLLKLDGIQKAILQLQSLGFSDTEIRRMTREVYNSLALLNPHIDEGRIVDIEKAEYKE